MHTAHDPVKSVSFMGFWRVMRNRTASYGGGLMARMESDESDTKRVTVRVPESLVDAYEESLDDDTNRSEDLRVYMRQQAKQPATDGGLTPPGDDEMLASAYGVLRRAAGEAPLPVDEAKSLIASQTNIPKSSVSRRALKPLRDRGYLRRCGDPINRPMLEVR
jgi:hypothetical protein